GPAAGGTTPWWSPSRPSRGSSPTTRRLPLPRICRGAFRKNCSLRLLAHTHRIHDRHRADEPVRIGIGLRPEHLRAAVCHLGDIKIALRMDVNLVPPVDLSGQRAGPADVEY